MELFADENDENKKSQQIHYDDAAIDRSTCGKLYILHLTFNGNLCDFQLGMQAS
jgi:hypothetical protein